MVKGENGISRQILEKGLQIIINTFDKEADICMHRWFLLSSLTGTV